MTNPHNEQGIFPELNLEVFHNLTQEWFQNYPAIRKVTLHRYQSKYDKYFSQPPITCYAVTFLLSEDIDPAARKILERDLGCFNTILDENYLSLLPESFAPGLYGGKRKIPADFRREWYFLIAANDEEFSALPYNLHGAHWNFTLLEDTKENKELPKQKTTEPLPQEFNFENFFKNLVIGYENDNEISIKEPRKTEKFYTANTLGFRNNADKGWKTFISVLQSPEKTYYIGKAGGENFKNKQYDSNRKRLIEINKKILKFIMNEFSLVLPKKFKIYERVKTEKPGTYRFKFQIKDEKTAFIDHPDPMLNKMSEKDLLKKIEWTKFHYDESTDENEKNRLREDLSILVFHAYQNTDIPRAKIDALLKEDQN